MDFQAEHHAPESLGIALEDVEFSFVEAVIPRCDAAGTILEFRPQSLYSGRDTALLHDHGHGAYCKFSITVPRGLMGVYALVSEGTVLYIGECVDLAKRFNAGYGQISPRNTYKNGQPTNCKINQRVLEVAREGDRVSLYFHPTADRKAVEKRLVRALIPAWNG